MTKRASSTATASDRPAPTPSSTPALKAGHPVENLTRLDEPTMRASHRRLGQVVEEVLLLRMAYQTLVLYLEATPERRAALEPHLQAVAAFIDGYYGHEGSDTLNRQEVADAG